MEAVAKAAKKLEEKRFLLPADVQAYIDEAQASTVLQGIDGKAKK